MSNVKRTDAIAGEIIHEYDGIEEADNELPTWWVAVFIGTILFGCVYWLVFEKYRALPSPSEALIAAQAEREKRTGQVSEEELLRASRDPAAVATGRQTFATNCVACHGAKAEGNIGPNLTDSHWLHGGAPSNIFGTIRDGVPAKGMPTWGPLLGADTLKRVTAYVLTLRNTNVPGKAPQGDEYKP